MKIAPAEKKSRRALLLCLIQFSAVLLAVNSDLNRDAVRNNTHRRLGQDYFLAGK